MRSNKLSWLDIFCLQDSKIYRLRSAGAIVVEETNVQEIVVNQNRTKELWAGTADGVNSAALPAEILKARLQKGKISIRRILRENPTKESSVPLFCRAKILVCLARHLFPPMTKKVPR